MRGRRGQTLLEVFMASILVTFIIFSLFTLYPAATSSLRRAEQQVTASNLAQQAVEEVRGMAFAQVVPLTTPLNVDGIDYTVVRDIPPLLSAQVKQVNIQVIWDAGRAVGKTSITCSTCIYDFTNPP